MIPCDPRLRVRLARVGQGLAPPDLLIHGCRVWNAFTGEVVAADVAICGDRIARIGLWTEPLGEGTRLLDGSGLVAVPGYIEPHTHPWPFLNPLNLGEAAVCRGTTCLVYDDLLLHLALGVERLGILTAAISARSLPHVFWTARIASQSRFEGEERVFSRGNAERLLRRPEFLATGEMTRWTDLLDPDRALRLLEIVELARGLGKFADGHTAGASVRRLPGLAAVGIRSCHEAIDAEEAVARLRQGLWVLLRHSSLRLDLVHLLPALGEVGGSDRFAYTTDGAMAHFVEENGFTDHLIRIALNAGVAPHQALRMATLNTAAYLGLDEDLGAVAPGRIAHVNLLRRIEEPTPEVVVCRGKVAARGGALTEPPPSLSFEWGRYLQGGEAAVPEWDAPTFALPASAPNPFPSARLENAVITREEPIRLAPRDGGLWPAEEGAMALALTDRSGRWITRGVVTRFAPGLKALATSYTTNGGVLVAGTSPEAMASALTRLREIGGGCVVVGPKGAPETFPLPLAGIGCGGDFAAAARESRGFAEAMARCGYAHADPNYTLLFFSCDFLPDLRAIEAGWVRVKTGEVLLPAQWFA